MKLEFDVKVTEKDLYSFNIEQAYKGSQGVISLLFAVLLAAAAVLSAQKGNAEYVVLYIIVGILVLLYVPFSLKGRVKMIMKTNEVFSKPLHFEVDEKLRNELAQSQFGKSFAECSEDEQKAITDYYPQKISEAEPKKYGGKK